jgi:hypothetical protein
MSSARPPEGARTAARQGEGSSIFRPWLPLVIALLASLAGVATDALAVNDPTRPPPIALALAAAASAPAAAPAAAAAAASAATPPPPKPVPLLQAVHFPAQGAPTALVDGVLVRTGDAVGDRTVFLIEHDSLILRGSNGEGERLRLLAGSSKQAAGSLVLSRSTRYGERATADPPAEAASTPTPRSRP